MIGAETADLIEWRPSPWWTLEWLALMLFVGLPFVALGGWLAAREISDAMGAVPVWYTVFCYILVGAILGAIGIGMLFAAAQYVRLLFDQRPTSALTGRASKRARPTSPCARCVGKTSPRLRSSAFAGPADTVNMCFTSWCGYAMRPVRK